MNIKGMLPLLLLHLLLGSAKHGYTLAKELNGMFFTVKEGALYPTLHRMESEGFIVSFKQEEGGRLCRYYQITELGRTQHDKLEMDWLHYADSVNVILNSGK